MIKRLLHRNTFLQAALVTGCLFFFACENDPQVINDLTSKKIMVEEAKDITSLFSVNGRMRARLIAPLMLRYQEDTVYVEFPKTLKVDFFDSTLQVESKLFAKYGKYFESQSKIFLRDSVVVYNIKGDTLRCPELWWDQNNQRFYTDKPAHLVRKGQDITGRNGMEASQDLTDIVFRRPSGRFDVPDSTQQ